MQEKCDLSCGDKKSCGMCRDTTVVYVDRDENGEIMHTVGEFIGECD